MCLGTGNSQPWLSCKNNCVLLNIKKKWNEQLLVCYSLEHQHKAQQLGNHCQRHQPCQGSQQRRDKGHNLLRQVLRLVCCDPFHARTNASLDGGSAGAKATILGTSSWATTAKDRSIIYAIFVGASSRATAANWPRSNSRCKWTYDHMFSHRFVCL